MGKSVQDVSLVIRDMLEAYGYKRPVLQMSGKLQQIVWDGNLFTSPKTPRNAMESVWAFIFSLHDKYKDVFLKSLGVRGDRFIPSRDRKGEAEFRKCAAAFIRSSLPVEPPLFHIMDKPYGDKFLAYTFDLFLAVTGQTMPEIFDEEHLEAMIELEEEKEKQFREYLTSVVDPCGTRATTKALTDRKAELDAEVIVLDRRINALKLAEAESDQLTLTDDDVSRIKELNQKTPEIDPTGLKIEPMPEVDLGPEVLGKYAENISTCPRAGFDVSTARELNKKIDVELVRARDELHRAEIEHEKEVQKITRTPLEEVNRNVAEFLENLNKINPVDLAHKPDLTSSTVLSDRSKMSKSKARRRTNFEVSDLLTTVREEADTVLSRVDQPEVDSFENPFLTFCEEDLEGFLSE